MDKKLVLLKFLRIAVSVLGLIACVLLLALWARSYGSIDSLTGPLIGTQGFSLMSDRGRLNIMVFSGGSDSDPRNEWGTSSYPVAIANWMVHSYAFRLGWIQPGSPHICVPHWFPALLTAAFAAAPWIRWRFSLRTLLIAVTVIATVLGIFAASL